MVAQIAMRKRQQNFSSSRSISAHFQAAIASGIFRLLVLVKLLFFAKINRVRDRASGHGTTYSVLDISYRSPTSKISTLLTLELPASIPPKTFIFEFKTALLKEALTVHNEPAIFQVFFDGQNMHVSVEGIFS